MVERTRFLPPSSWSSSSAGLCGGATRPRSAAALDTDPWQTSELLQRIQASDVAPGTLATPDATIFELCCQYARRDAAELRAEAQGWLQRVAALLRKPVGLKAHQELLASAGWLALLIGCLEYDLGMRAGAEATQVAAQQLGHEAGHSEIVGWTHEMAAWFALTQGRYADVIAAARAGQEAGRNHSVVVQLVAQEAKALGRVGSIPELRRVLDHGQQLLNGFPTPTRTDNHFIVDPAKWDFYAMDACRLVGDDELATRHALEVLRNGISPEGIELSPMRVSEARLTLGVAAARSGELEEATDLGIAALSGPRRSLPTLLMVAGELDGELNRRYPDEPLTADFRERLRALHRQPA